MELWPTESDSSGNWNTLMQTAKSDTALERRATQYKYQIELINRICDVKATLRIAANKEKAQLVRQLKDLRQLHSRVELALDSRSVL
jgi:hypothetical protein